MKKSFLVLLCSFVSLSFFGQVTVDINSGNPNFPFPQFSAYGFETNHSLGNLGTQTPIGVTHAEMEQRIKDAWQIMANRFEYTNETYQGIKYINATEGCAYDCSEASGYAMLGAAYMADKTTFDGLWMRNHDVRLVAYPKYSDCIAEDATYRYGKNTLEDGFGDAASDGSFDMALALLVAWKQWGEFMGINDACGNPISYKEEALKVIKGLVEITNSGYDNCSSTSGSIGFDGYVKNGNTWGETTNWASSVDTCPQFTGPTNMHPDYMAPSYFKQFRTILETEEGSSWNTQQFLRAEASSDWVMSKTIEAPKGIPSAGWATITGDQVVFEEFNMGEDFRLSWRTNLNHVWHGNPNYSWDPITHQVITDSANTYEKDVAERYTLFLNDPTASPWENQCGYPGESPVLTFKGASDITSYNLLGESTSSFPTNWTAGAASSSVVAAQDYQLMAEFYRQCAIEYDVNSTGDGYLTSVPKYFHGWFRLLGMLTLTGNFQAPSQMIAQPNLKVYQSINKTAARTDEEVTYTLNFRNYGSIAANNTIIQTVIPQELEIVEISNGGTFNSGNQTITWNIGSVTGFDGTNEAETTDSVSYKVKVKSNEQNSFCLAATISCANGSSHTSDQYPNNKTAVMERNCLDIIPNSLVVETYTDTSNYLFDSLSIVTISVENTETEPLTGGRPNVFLSYAHQGTSETFYQHYIKTRIFHGADEPYIDYGNYRISMFVFDETLNCLSTDPNCTASSSWTLDNETYEGGDFNSASPSIQPLAYGSDELGEWNQKITLQFAPAKATTTPHLSRYYIGKERIHEGVFDRLLSVWRLHATNYSNINWKNDWSWNTSAQDQDNRLFHPISPSFTEKEIVEPVTSWHKNACETANNTIENVLVEEWDGYIWRKIYGNSPVNGTTQNNVIISDTLPSNVVFVGFIDSISAGNIATYNSQTHVVSLNIPSLSIGHLDSISYKIKVVEPESCLASNATRTSNIYAKSDESTVQTPTYDYKTNCSTVTGVNNKTIGFKLFPSPVESILIVQSTDATNYQILTIHGSKVLDGTLTSGENTIDLSFLQSGTYIFSSEIYKEKILKY